MEENQTNQNLNQQPVQPVQPQPEQVQQPVQWQPQPAEQASVSMQIQQLLVQQQQYQQQYNQLVDYVKKTPNLPIEQVNQIKQQLDQLNALFVQWKQKLQSLWYTQVQVNKPAEVKRWAKSNFSFKKLAIGCVIVVVLILAWFFVTLSSLIKNPGALQWIWVDAAMAKMLLQAFTWLLFWSIIILMVWVIISNIYRLITVKNQSKGRFVLWLIWWFLWAGIIWAAMWVIFWKIWNIETEVVHIDYDVIQPYLVWRVEQEWVDEFEHPYDNESISGIWNKYSLIAPAEMAFALRWDEFSKLREKSLPAESEIIGITLFCGNGDENGIELSKSMDKHWWYKFKWTCLYSKKWTYTYSINVTYNNTISKERKTESFTMNSLDFTSEISLYKTTTTSSSANNKTSALVSENGEFILWQAPAKITVDSTQIFRDFALWSYEVEWDLDGDFESDRVNQTMFDYSYRIPKVYYVTFKFPWLSNDTWYRFPVRVEQSDRPVCGINLTRFPWSTKYQIYTDFVDESSAATISSYRYTIQNYTTKKTLEVLDKYPQEFNYTFPDKGSYVVILDYLTVDEKQWQCESDVIQLEKETFSVDYSISEKDITSGKFTEVCNSNEAEHDKCRQISSNEVPKTYRLYIKSIKPYSNTMKRAVYLDDLPLLNDEDMYTFDISTEWTYNLKIVLSDLSKWMEEETINIQITIKKADIIWKISILSAGDRKDITEWFEPLSVILDASKTEVNIPGDEIVYFSWDFGDGEVKKDQQNWVVSHLYRYDYTNENGIFTPKVTIKTSKNHVETIVGPTLNVKKQLISVDISSFNYPSRQAPAWMEVEFSAEFDWLPEKMTWDFGDWSPVVECRWRSCTDTSHIYKEAGLFTVRLTLDFESIQQVDWAIDFKVY